MTRLRQRKPQSMISVNLAAAGRIESLFSGEGVDTSLASAGIAATGKTVVNF
jgi:hypothetical protein